MLHESGSRHRGCDVDHHRHDRLHNVACDGRPVVDAVLQAQHDRVRAQVRRDLARDRIGIGGLDAEEHEVGVAHCVEPGRRGDAQRLGATGHLQLQATRLDRLDVRRTRDQRDRVARAREHRAKKTADGAGADDGCGMKRCGHADA